MSSGPLDARFEVESIAATGAGTLLAPGKHRVPETLTPFGLVGHYVVYVESKAVKCGVVATIDR